MNPFQNYLRDLAQIRSTGAAVPETSYYGTLERLLNEIGKTLKPKVRCVINLANRGAGIPDGGLFTANQFQRGSAELPAPGTLPERGVIEVKPAGDDAFVTADGEQVSRYWGRYGLVLVTNYRDFVLMGKNAVGEPVKLETFRLAGDESDFWSLAQNAHNAPKLHGERFVEYLKRVMLHAAPLSTSQDVAWFLASYARDAKARIEYRPIPALAAVREALEESLGLQFEGDKGEHFFRSTLVQTLFYGVFSAWVLWHKENPSRTDKFDWKQAAWSLHVPMIRTLFHQVADPAKLQPLGLVEPLDWASATLNRVERGAFFSTFEQGRAVQYFYEPFLQQFDPELRKDLGVWYTPPEIVKYMVARVDTVLREELEIPDGLADPRVYILDPCCGTGAYLVEVLHRITETLKAKGTWDALAAQDLKKAAMQRIFGFEIMPAPFVVAHLQLGLLLQQLGAPLSHASSERVAIYLTNALTGWEPPRGPKQHLMFQEMEQERDAAEEVKRNKRILVILGNPPYNAFAGVSPAEEEGLVKPYKEGLVRQWGIKKFNLDDLYVRFFRLAERKITEMEPYKGVVCYISNFSYLNDPSFVAMRQRFMEKFDKLWFDCMNGDSRETGKLTPEGKPDPSVFSTEYQSVGIRVGTAIGLMVRKELHAGKPVVRFRDFWGVAKRNDLLESLKSSNFDASYKIASPKENNRLSFQPSDVAAHYMEWPKLVDLCAEPPSNGLMEKRGGALIDIDRDALERRMRMYYDPTVRWEDIESLKTGLTEDAAGFEPHKVRLKIQTAEPFTESHLRCYALRPFDTRWCYYSNISPLWNRSRPTLWSQCFNGNSFLMTRPVGMANPEGFPLFFTRSLGDNDFLRGHAYYFPIRLCHEGFFDNSSNAALNANLSEGARSYLTSFGIENPDADAETAGLIWMHALAVGYSPAYLRENADGVRQDWPRVPLPTTREALLASARLGQEVARLLDNESRISGVNSGAVRVELRSIGVIDSIGGGAINPQGGGLDLTAGWGHAGKAGAVMPGAGKIVERDYTPEELEAIRRGAETLGMTLDAALSQLGGTTRDVYLNNSAYWRNIPGNVWEYVIGGYQVIKKWLSYRQRDILGRGLTMDEAREVMNTTRRLAAILLWQPALDANYQAIKASCYAWPEKREKK